MWFGQHSMITNIVWGILLISTLFPFITNNFYGSKVSQSMCAIPMGGYVWWFLKRWNWTKHRLFSKILLRCLRAALRYIRMVFCQPNQKTHWIWGEIDQTESLVHSVTITLPLNKLKFRSVSCTYVLYIFVFLLICK